MNDPQCAKTAWVFVSAGLCLVLLLPRGGKAADVLTYHNDNARTGQNLQETVLSPANVNSQEFGLLGVLPADGKVDAQPLYAAGLSIPGQGPRNVLFVATEHDTVYAFDAATFNVLWQVSLLGDGETPSDDRGCDQVTLEIGITATPVIDRQFGPNGTIFLVAMSMDSSGQYYQRLHALDLATGADLLPPATITATYPGTGDGSVGGTLFFDPAQYKERASLLLLNGVIYTAWASHCDSPPYTGWIIGYDERTLAQTNVLNITPNGSAGAIWMSGAGPAADAQGNIYLLAANGTLDTDQDDNGFPSQGDFGNGFLKISSSGSTLAVSDYFATSDTLSQNAVDEDLGSGGALVLPDMLDGQGAVRQLAVGAGKDASIYLVDRSNMGGFSPIDDSAVYQKVTGALAAGVWSMPAYFNGTLYYGADGDYLKAFPFQNARLADSSSQSPDSFGYPGMTPGISANGNLNGIVWGAENDSPAVLHAFAADNLANELYNSDQAANGRDHFGDGNKFITPTIADGRVYVGTTGGVGVFGLLARSVLTVTGISADNKTYDGTTAASLVGTPLLVGVAPGDDVVLGGTPAANFLNKNAGNAKPVIVTGFTLSGANADKYVLQPPAGLAANVNPASASVTGLTAIDKVYDATAAANLTGTALLTGVLGTDDVSLNGAVSAAFEHKNVGTNKPVTVIGLTLGGGDRNNYVLTVPVLAAKVTPAPLNVIGLSAGNKVYDSTTEASLNGVPGLNGVLGSDDVSLTGTVLGAFVDKNVGNAKPVNVTGLGLAGGDAGNYRLTAPVLAANITLAALNVMGLSAGNKVYDSTTEASLNGVPVLNGVLGLDDVSLTGTAVGGFVDKNVGNAKPVNVSGLGLAGNDAGNYRLTAPVLAANITPAALSVIGLSAGNKLYDNTTAASLNGVPGLNGVLGSDDVSLSGAAVGGFVDKNVGNAKPVNVSGLGLAGNDAGNYRLTAPVLAANITPAALNVMGLSAGNKVYDSTTEASLNGVPGLNGVLGSDDVSLTGTALGAFVEKNVGNAKPVNVTGLGLAGGDAGNYRLTAPVLAANITPAALNVIGLSAGDKVYDSTTAASLNGAPGLNGVLGSDDVSLTGTALGAFVDKNVGNAKSVNVSGLGLAGNDAGNYTLTKPVLAAKIIPAMLTVTADDQNRPYGLANPTLTVAYSGFVGGEDFAVLSGTPDVTTTATSSSLPGAYTITVAEGTLSAANYTFSFVNGTLTVTADVPTVVSITGAGSPTVTITWSSVDQVKYRVQYASDLAGDAWSDLAPDVTATGSTASATDHPADASPRFYRILVVPE